MTDREDADPAGRGSKNPPPRNPIRIVIVEPHIVIREGLTALLAKYDDVEIVGTLATIGEGAELVGRKGADVMLVEVAQPGGGGAVDIGAIRSISALPSAPAVVILSNYSTAEHLLPALRAGVRGFVSKQGGSTALIDGIHRVAEGRLYMCPIVADLFLRTLVLPGTTREGTPSKPLTAREREVLALIGRGKTDREIGGMLGLSASTVHSHRIRIMGKLDVHGIAMLIRRAMQLGLIET
jgi:DNA-binding NarL/FixJ family response regulator